MVTTWLASTSHPVRGGEKEAFVSSRTQYLAPRRSSSFIMLNPASLLRRRSVQAGVYPNVFSAARSITDAAGTRGLFTGYLPTLLEDVPDMAFKFAAYESLRSLRLRLMKGRKASPQVCSHTDS